MTTKERFLRAFRHEEADRVPITDSPWNGTLARWRREGMPANADWREYFGADKVETIGVDISPRYPEKILEETDRYVISTSPWGVTMKQFKHEDSTPEFLDYKVTTPEAWAKAKSLAHPLGTATKGISALAGGGPLDPGGVLVWFRRDAFLDGRHGNHPHRHDGGARVGARYVRYVSGHVHRAF